MAFDIKLPPREAIARAYAFVKGSELASSFYTFTFEEALQQQLDRLLGAGQVQSELEKIDAIKNNLLAAISQIESGEPPAITELDNDS